MSVTRISIVALTVSIIAACGGADIAASNKAPDPILAAGRGSMSADSLAKPHAARWSGIQFCEGSVGGESLKSSEEVEQAAFEKTQTRVRIADMNVGSSDDYSCAAVTLEGLVTMGSQSGVFFDGAEPVECASPNGRGLTVKLLHGHDTDLRFIEPTDAPTLSFEVVLTETVTDAENALGVSTLSKARFNCSFDLELR